MDEGREVPFRQNHPYQISPKNSFTLGSSRWLRLGGETWQTDEWALTLFSSSLMCRAFFYYFSSPFFCTCARSAAKKIQPSLSLAPSSHPLSRTGPLCARVLVNIFSRLLMDEGGVWKSGRLEKLRGLMAEGVDAKRYYFTPVPSSFKNLPLPIVMESVLSSLLLDYTFLLPLVITRALYIGLSLPSS